MPRSKDESLLSEKIIVMKKIVVLSIFACLFVGAAWAQKTITVLHTSDTHSCILPQNANLADTVIAGRGGFLRRIAMLEQERQKDPNLLLFDTGDFSQGSSYYTMFKGDVEVGLMNQMHYDAGTIGNHEFDFGLENMTRLFKMLNFPIVCSNYDFTGTELQDIVKPYLIIKRQGVKIGIIGLCPPLEGLVSTKNYGPIKFLDPIEKAQEMVDLLKNKKKCDVVICLSHLGWTGEDYPDEKLIPGTQGIDLVLGGHSHSYLKELGYLKDKSGHSVPVDHEGKHGVFVGKMQLKLEKK